MWWKQHSSQIFLSLLWTTSFEAYPQKYGRPPYTVFSRLRGANFPRCSPRTFGSLGNTTCSLLFVLVVGPLSRLLILQFDHPWPWPTAQYSHLVLLSPQLLVVLLKKGLNIEKLKTILYMRPNLWKYIFLFVSNMYRTLKVANYFRKENVKSDWQREIQSISMYIYF